MNRKGSELSFAFTATAPDLNDNNKESNNFASAITFGGGAQEVGNSSDANKQLYTPVNDDNAGLNFSARVAEQVANNSSNNYAKQKQNDTIVETNESVSQSLVLLTSNDQDVSSSSNDLFESKKPHMVMVEDVSDNSGPFPIQMQAGTDLSETSGSFATAQGSLAQSNRQHDVFTSERTRTTPNYYPG